jgi:glycerophosphoryl diester phosphodiesterase
MVEVKGMVQVVAHRGDPAHAPENTLASFRQAVAKGATAVEVDLRRSADGVWVAFHDPTLGRTTNGSGWLRKKRWEELRALDAGGWFSSLFRGERIPRLRQVLDFCREQGVEIFLDVKVKGREADLVRTLRRSGWFSHIAVGYGQPTSLEKWRRLLPGSPLFWVTGFRAPITARRVSQARRWKVTGLASYKGWVTRRTIGRVHEAGLKLYVWTARTPAEVKRLAACGVDGIMSEVWPHPWGSK